MLTSATAPSFTYVSSPVPATLPGSLHFPFRDVIHQLQVDKQTMHIRRQLVFQSYGITNAHWRGYPSHHIISPLCVSIYIAPQHMESVLRTWPQHPVMSTTSWHLLAIWRLYWGGYPSRCDMTDLVWPHATLIFAGFCPLVSHVSFWTASYFPSSLILYCCWLTDPVLMTHRSSVDVTQCWG